MSSMPGFALLSWIVLAALPGSPSPTPTGAPPSITPTPQMMVDTCLTQDADLVAVRDWKVVDIVSPTDAIKVPLYSKKTNGCKKFVADLKLEALANGSGLSLLWNEPVFSKSKATCESMEFTSYAYVKQPGETAFTLVGGGTYKGHWDAPNNYCQNAKQPGFKDFPFGFARPKTGETLIRVISGGKVGTAPAVMSVKLG